MIHGTIKFPIKLTNSLVTIASCKIIKKNHPLIKMHEENTKSKWKQLHHLVKITRTTHIVPNYMKELQYNNFTIDVAPKSSECYQFSKMMPFPTESNQFSIIDRKHMMQIVTIISNIWIGFDCVKQKINIVTSSRLYYIIVAF